MLFDLRRDPFKRAKESGDYPQRRVDRGNDGRIRHVRSSDPQAIPAL